MPEFGIEPLSYLRKRILFQTLLPKGTTRDEP